MTRYSKQVARLSAIAAAVFVAAPAFAAAALDANAEFDTTWVDKARITANDTLTQGGRIEVNITGKTMVGDAWAAGRGTLILGESSAGRGNVATVDDAWVEGGIGAFSIRLGRFEATALAGYPDDVLVVGRVGYMGDRLRGRSIGRQDSYVNLDATSIAGANGNAAVNGQPHFAIYGDLGGGVKLEIGIVEMNTGSNVTGTDNPSFVPPTGSSKSIKLGVRPLVSVAAGPISAAVGFEKSGLPGAKVGFAATGSYNFGPGSVGVNAATEGKNTDLGETSSGTGYGVFGTFGPFTAAAQAGKDHFGHSGNYFYAVYKMPFFIDKATFAIAASTGKIASGVAGVGSYRDAAIRARVHYDF